ncbi:type IV pilin protein [Alteromonas sp. C1M14]|uniref:type IV pilin protein n=1 Tax=Alteromonas sp. C1M14 TaxID=2841567 RepID=UPI001C089C1F|nr:type IV pilin protein [Alteromonas sp. C1M14]MBU2979095.1 hypothetical protein [Alteromonas sp. C1M14]
MKNTGWTLLSLLIALVIIGILSSATLPGYSHVIQQYDINNARNQLLRWQAEQISHRLENSQYADISELSAAEESAFIFKVSKVSATTYQLSATRKALLGEECDQLWVNQSGHYLPYSCWH